MNNDYMQKIADATIDNLDYINEMAKRVNHLADCILLLSARLDKIERKLSMLVKENDLKVTYFSLDEKKKAKSANPITSAIKAGDDK